jgi:hypothetical protein
MSIPPIPSSGPTPPFPVASRYRQPLVIKGQAIPLQHLDPHILQCPITEPQLPNPLLINVRYSDHCFSEKFDPATHTPDLLLPRQPNSKDLRAFDQIRHALSLSLPGLVGDLPTRRVNFTSEPRNYVYAVSLSHPDPAYGQVPYGVFFQLKRAGAGAIHLDLTVVSAYSAGDTTIGIRKRPDHIRFLVLAAKTYRGQPVQAHRR